MSFRYIFNRLVLFLLIPIYLYIIIHLLNDTFLNSVDKKLIDNLTLIDIKNFNFTINNNVCGNSHVDIITIVHSYIGNQEARHIIRYL